MWFKRITSPGLYGNQQFLIICHQFDLIYFVKIGQILYGVKIAVSCKQAKNKMGMMALIIPTFFFIKRFGTPVTLRNIQAGVIGRIKNVVKPVLCVGETLVLAQRIGDHQRSMKKQFPVVLAIGTF